LSFRFSAYVIHTGLYLVYLQNKISRCNFLSEVRFFFLVREIRHWSIMRHLFGEGEQGLKPWNRR
jgi:hypothetical protein